MLKIAALVAFFVVLQLALVRAEEGACKGREQAQCSEPCKWMPARIAGETKKANGEAHKTSAKAHCRKPVTRKS
jgi:hypothetical protein